MVPVRAEAFRCLKAVNAKDRQASKPKSRTALGISRGRAPRRLPGDSERDRKAAILKALNLYRASLRVWNAPAGVARSFDGKRVIRYGLPGQADITGMVHDGAPMRLRGKRIEIEVKTPRGRLSSAQQEFSWMIRSGGGFYIVARTPQEALDALRREGVIKGSSKPSASPPPG